VGDSNVRGELYLRLIGAGRARFSFLQRERVYGCNPSRLRQCCRASCLMDTAGASRPVRSAQSFNLIPPEIGQSGDFFSQTGQPDDRSESLPFPGRSPPQP